MTVAEPAAGKTTFTYRGDGRRVDKQTPGGTTKFFYDVNRLLQETDASDQLEREYTSTLNQWGDLVSEYDGSDTAYHLHDALGSTDALLDDAQSATDHYRAFGAQSQTGTHPTPFTFVGSQNYYRDAELDLYFPAAPLRPRRGAVAERSSRRLWMSRLASGMNSLCPVLQVEFLDICEIGCVSRDEDAAVVQHSRGNSQVVSAGASVAGAQSMVLLNGR